MLDKSSNHELLYTLYITDYSTNCYNSLIIAIDFAKTTFEKQNNVVLLNTPNSEFKIHHFVNSPNFQTNASSRKSPRTGTPSYLLNKQTKPKKERERERGRGRENENGKE